MLIILCPAFCFMLFLQSLWILLVSVQYCCWPLVGARDKGKSWEEVWVKSFYLLCFYASCMAHLFVAQRYSIFFLCNFFWCKTLPNTFTYGLVIDLGVMSWLILRPFTPFFFFFFLFFPPLGHSPSFFSIGHGLSAAVVLAPVD